MSSKKLDPTAGGRKRDPDFINAEIAIKRAARKAGQRAQQAGVGYRMARSWKNHQITKYLEGDRQIDSSRVQR